MTKTYILSCEPLNEDAYNSSMRRVYSQANRFVGHRYFDALTGR